MSKKPYKTKDNVQTTVGEPIVAYESRNAQISSSGDWNPNLPFHGTQEEWWEHFHRIEQGSFYTIEEADEEFEIWKKKLLASRL
ncbi:MAG: hypothetical protein LBT25_13365 [Candidatus Symbiothrix sp.]|jgi:hypothetical protein|nr:hypothetical protein [Candidatus Symbiothrix sp.]